MHCARCFVLPDLSSRIPGSCILFSGLPLNCIGAFCSVLTLIFPFKLFFISYYKFHGLLHKLAENNSKLLKLMITFPLSPTTKTDITCLRPAVVLFRYSIGHLPSNISLQIWNFWGFNHKTNYINGIWQKLACRINIRIVNLYFQSEIF